MPAAFPPTGSQRAVLDSEIANAERIAMVLSAKLVSLQKALRAASGQVPVARLDKAAANYPVFPDDFAEVAYRWSEFSKSPVLGDPTAATAGKGEAILDAVLDRMAELVATLHGRGSAGDGTVGR